MRTMVGSEFNTITNKYLYDDLPARGNLEPRFPNLEIGIFSNFEIEGLHICFVFDQPF